MTVVTIPKPLRDKLGNEATEALVEVLNQLSNDTRNDVLTLAEERFVRRLTESISALRQELKDEQGELHNELTQLHNQLTQLHNELTQLHNQQTQLRNEQTQLRNEQTQLRNGQTQLRNELKEDIRQLSIQVEKNHTNMIKWMFIFWIGQATVIMGLIVGLIRFLK